MCIGPFKRVCHWGPLIALGEWQVIFSIHFLLRLMLLVIINFIFIWLMVKYVKWYCYCHCYVHVIFFMNILYICGVKIFYLWCLWLKQSIEEFLDSLYNSQFSRDNQVSNIRNCKLPLSMVASSWIVGGDSPFHQLHELCCSYAVLLLARHVHWPRNLTPPLATGLFSNVSK